MSYEKASLPFEPDRTKMLTLLDGYLKEVMSSIPKRDASVEMKRIEFRHAILREIPSACEMFESYARTSGLELSAPRMEALLLVLSTYESMSFINAVVQEGLTDEEILDVASLHAVKIMTDKGNDLLGLLVRFGRVRTQRQEMEAQKKRKKI